MTVREAIARVAAGHDLSEQEMALVTAEIMDGQATPAQIGALLTGLHVKGEVVAEITGAARVMRDRATRVEPPGPVIDTCGTGGMAAAPSTFPLLRPLSLSRLAAVWPSTVTGPCPAWLAARMSWKRLEHALN